MGRMRSGYRNQKTLHDPTTIGQGMYAEQYGLRQEETLGTLIDQGEKVAVSEFDHDGRNALRYEMAPRGGETCCSKIAEAFAWMDLRENVKAKALKTFCRMCEGWICVHARNHDAKWTTKQAQDTVRRNL